MVSSCNLAITFPLSGWEQVQASRLGLMQWRWNPFLQQDRAKERKTAWPTNAGLIISFHALLWLDGAQGPGLNSEPFSCRASNGTTEKQDGQNSSNGHNLGFPEAVSQSLVKAKDSVCGKFKGKQFYWDQDNKVLKSPMVYFKTILEGYRTDRILQSTTSLSMFRVFQNRSKKLINHSATSRF